MKMARIAFALFVLVLVGSNPRTVNTWVVGPEEKATVGGKYIGLERVIHDPDDRAQYGRYNDFGLWTGDNHKGLNGLPTPCYWVYVHPRWYLWKDCTVPNPTPRKMIEP